MGHSVYVNRQAGPGQWQGVRIDPRKDYAGYLESDAWAEKRAAAIEAAGHACERCGFEYKLQVHHKTYARLGDEAPEDLEVLCAGCHADEHSLDF